MQPKEVRCVFLEDYFGVQTNEVIAFGDNFNDLDMLQHAGLGVAMEMRQMKLNKWQM